QTGASVEEKSTAEELTTLYIGNLNYKVNENAIKTHFEKYGYVDSVRLMKDRKTGRRKGFGFVEVDVNSADKMITKLNDSTFEERTLRVRLAKEKSED
ncbi:MAG: RNA-binding protein, partial [Glaciecola sp.]|nr:RNA-binding protein [Glaciecola sp.]